MIEDLQTLEAKILRQLQEWTEEEEDKLQDEVMYQKWEDER